MNRALAMSVASLGGIGRLHPGPGTWGSAAVLPAALLGPLPCLLLAIIVATLGLWAVATLREPGDPGWIVVDEGAGQLLALAGLPAEAGWTGVLAAFLLFRLFDIAKPGPVGWADRQAGARGVLLDDLFAGAIVAALLLATGALWPGLLR